ncbi:hypothetical protein [Flyfo microvirus Tbat2_98]|nr:hypothetical protein [Flyfo microvirus Tbat2_98]
MVAAAAVAAGASLIGGLLDNKNNEKAANTAFRYQIDLNNQALWSQQLLTGEQNRQTNALNDRVAAYNREVLDHHSTNKTSSTTVQTDETSSFGTIDFKRMVADAEAAGFNPLTVLRAGGMAGYTSSNVKTMSRLEQNMEQKVARDIMTFFAMPDAAQAQNPGQAPVPQTTNAFSNAIQTGLSVWQQGNADRLARERLDVEKGLAAAQISNLASDSALNKARATQALRIPTTTMPTTYRQGGGFNGAVRNNTGVLGKVSTPKEGETTVTAPWAFMDVNPILRDAQSVEARYGEIAGDLYGLGVVAADAGGAVVRNASPTYEKYVKPATSWYMGHVNNGIDYLKQNYEAAKKSYTDFKAKN